MCVYIFLLLSPPLLMLILIPVWHLLPSTWPTSSSMAPKAVVFVRFSFFYASLTRRLEALNSDSSGRRLFQIWGGWAESWLLLAFVRVTGREV